MGNVVVRTANIGDLPTLLEFEQGVIAAERPFDRYLKDDPISYYDLGALIQSDIAEVVVAEIEGKLVGSGSAKIVDSKKYVKHDHHAHLGFMYVDAAHRGLGINELIINALKDWSRTQNISHLYLDVYAGNAAAIRAYEKSGFESNMLQMRVDLNDA